jgi:hypothetical protein
MDPAFSGGNFFPTRYQFQLLEIISDQLSWASSAGIPLPPNGCKAPDAAMASAS